MKLSKKLQIFKSKIIKKRLGILLVLVLMLDAFLIGIWVKLNIPSNPTKPNREIAFENNNYAQISPSIPKDEYTLEIYSETDGVHKLIKTYENTGSHPIMANGAIYFTDNKGYDTSGKNLLKFDPSTNTTSTEYISDEIIQLKSHKNSNLFYFTTFKEPFDYEKTQLTLYEFNPLTKTARKILKKIPVFYGSLSLESKINNIDIVSSFGGDGCGGWGEVYSVDNEKITNTIKIGFGCSMDPRYLKLNENKNSVILASVMEPVDKSDPSDFNDYDRIYFQNLLTNEKEEIYDLKPDMNDIEEIYFDDKTQAIWIIKNSHMISINPDTKVATKIEYPNGIKITKYSSLDLENGTLTILLRNEDDSSYADYKYKLDLITGKLEKLNENIHTESSIYKVLGEFNGKKYYYKLLRNGQEI
jgi:hypothetical protein